MGEWDAYCAVCGAVMYNPVFADDQVAEDVDDEGSYDPALVSRADLDWLASVRILGWNAHAPLPSKAFVTGVGQGWQYGRVSCDDGDDPNVPQGDAFYGSWVA